MRKKKAKSKTAAKKTGKKRAKRNTAKKPLDPSEGQRRHRGDREGGSERDHESSDASGNARTTGTGQVFAGDGRGVPTVDGRESDEQG